MSTSRRPAPVRRLPRAALAPLVPLVLAASLALAATPARRPAAPAPPVAIRFPADSVMLAGEWFGGPAHAPVVVIGPRRRGSDPEMREIATEFQRRGFAALVFTLRDTVPADRDRDTLRYAVLASRWVDDMVAALRAAHARDTTAHVFAWGQGLGGALAISAAAREPGLCDAIAAEDVFPTVDHAMRMRGTAVIPEAVKLQWKLLRGGDEPFSASARLNLPVYAILVGHGAGDVGDPVLQAFRRNRGRTDRWLRPGVASPAPPPGPAQIDTLTTWLRRWTAFPRPKS